MTNVHNTFDPLKEIILGDVDVASINMQDQRKQKRIEHIFHKTKDELEHFQSVLEDRGIVCTVPPPFPTRRYRLPIGQHQEPRYH